MEGFNYNDVAVLMQISVADAKLIVAPEQVKVTLKDTISEKDLDGKLKHQGLTTKELIRRRSLVHQSQDQFAKLLRDTACVKKLGFSSRFSIYERILPEETKEKLMIAWLNRHAQWYKDDSLEEAICRLGKKMDSVLM